MSEVDDLADAPARDGTSDPASAVLCLSGGGKRAALFSLGALWAVHDAGAAPRISTIASVSGSGLTNAHVALSGGFEAAESFEHTGTQVRRELVEQYHRVSRRSMVAVVLTVPIFFIAATFRNGRPTEEGSAVAWYISVFIAFSIVGLPWGLALAWGLRSALQRLLIARSLSRMACQPWYRAFNPPALTKLLERRICHVWHATEVASGDPFALHAGGAASIEVNYSGSELSLRKAVMASMAYPGVFRPEKLKYYEDLPKGALRRLVTVSQRCLRLADGGLFNNLATAGVPGWPPEPHWQPGGGGLTYEHDFVVVVDAEKHYDPAFDRLETTSSGVRRVFRAVLAMTSLPVLGALYRNHHRTLRSIAEVTELLALAPGEDSCCAYLRLTASPLEYVRALSEVCEDSRKERAEMVEARLLSMLSEESWTALRDRNVTVKTDLARISPVAADELILQGYASAMAFLAVHWNLDVDERDFGKLVERLDPDGEGSDRRSSE